MNNQEVNDVASAKALFEQAKEQNSIILCSLSDAAKERSLLNSIPFGSSIPFVSISFPLLSKSAMKKPTSLVVILAIALAGLFVSPNATAQDSFADTARSVFENHSSSVIGIKAILKLDIAMNGQSAGAQEVPVWGNAIVIDDNLAVACYRSIMPEVSLGGAAGGELPEGVTIDRKLESVKLVNEAGDEFEAKLVIHDESLNLAFVAIDPTGENAADFDVSALSIEGDIQLTHLDKTFRSA